MKCPKCGYFDSKVIDTRVVQDADSIRRRRVCLNCGHKVFTIEVICAEYPVVIKRDGKEEEFDKEKIKIGLFKAFKKCAEVDEKVDRILTMAISEIISNHCDKISSEKIGVIVMNALKNSDQVAYLRFVSVYKNFETADDFVSEFGEISKSN